MNLQSDNQFKISVVIPAYNAGAHIGRTIDSVLKQTRPADEIIIVDDGSTDNTAEAIRQYESKVRLICQENGGASAARNTGINAAAYEWIAFLDGDDEWLDGYLETQIDLLKRNPELVWTGANYIVCYCNDDLRRNWHEIEKGKKILGGKDYLEDYFIAHIHGTIGWTGTMIIRKDVLEEAGMFRGGQLMANDTDMWWRIAYSHPKMGYNTEPLAIYHSHVEDSITKKHRDPQILFDLMERHIQIATDCHQFDRFKPLASSLVTSWIRGLLFKADKKNICYLMKTYGYLLKPLFKILITILMVFPKLTAVVCRAISKVVRTFNLRKKTILRPGR